MACPSLQGSGVVSLPVAKHSQARDKSGETVVMLTDGALVRRDGRPQLAHPGSRPTSPCTAVTATGAQQLERLLRLLMALARMDSTDQLLEKLDQAEAAKATALGSYS
nr:hypothetical protein CFP56_09495 [Quercus suber]